MPRKSKAETASYLKRWRAANPGKDKQYRDAQTDAQRAARLQQNRAWKFVTKYGLTMDQFTEMLRRQRNQCAICGTKIALRRHGEGHVCRQGSALVDHDHRTGRVRGLLCVSCNFLLGYAEDDIPTLEQAIRYLKEHQDGVE